LLPAFVDKTAAEKENLFYGFTVNGDEVFCREGYTDAEGVLAHLDNVGALLAEALKTADLARLELHGPAEELDKLKGPLASQSGVVRSRAGASVSEMRRIISDECHQKASAPENDRPYYCLS
jgi:hypothetical protein